MEEYFSKFTNKGLPGGPNELKAFTEGFITSSEGQWAYPGMNTLIPNADGRITMQGVDYPVLGIDDLGNQMMMQPGEEYQFPGDSVYEIPMKKGGLVKMPKLTKKNKKAYDKKFSRSIDATSRLFTESPLFAKPKSKKRKIFDPKSQYQDGGIMDQGEPTGGVTSQEEIDAANNAMMKARLAYAQMHGNPAAQRMVVAPDQPYVFDHGDTGTHFMASMDNYAVPLIQDVNGQLMLGDFGPESAEAMRFDNPEDAMYFAEHYKEITPDESYRKEYPEEDYIEAELTPEEIEEYRKGGYIIEDLETYPKGGGPGKGKDTGKKSTKFKPKGNVAPFVTSDPEEYAYRKAAYEDSLSVANTNNRIMPKPMRRSTYYRPFTNIPYLTINPRKTRTTIEKDKSVGIDRLNEGAQSRAWEDFMYNQIMQDKKLYPDVENYPVAWETKSNFFPHHIDGFFGDSKEGTWHSDTKPRYQPPRQKVIFQKPPVPSKTKPKPKEHQYPTEYKPVINNVPKSAPEGKKIIGEEEVQQLDSKTGKVTTVINPVYEDLEKPIPTLHPTRVNPELKKFIYPETTTDETTTNEDTEEVEEAITPEEQVYIDEEGNYVDMGRKGILPDLYIDTHKHKFSTPKYRVRRPGHGGDLVKRVGTNYHYLPGIERGLSSQSYMDYKQDGGEYEEAELTDEEIEEYRKGGWVVEEIEEYDNGGGVNFQSYEQQLRQLENSVKAGYKGGKWYPHDSVEGGNKTIGYGHKLSGKENYSQGLTTAQVLALQKKDLARHTNIAKYTVDKKYGAGTFDKLPESRKVLLVDYAYNGVLHKFPNFMAATVKGDKAGMLKEYKRYTNGAPLSQRNAWTRSVIEGTSPATKQVNTPKPLPAKPTAKKQAVKKPVTQPVAKPKFSVNETFSYDQRPGAVYKVADSGDWFINLGNDTHNEFVKLNDPTGKRTELLKKYAHMNEVPLDQILNRINNSGNYDSRIDLGYVPGQ